MGTGDRSEFAKDANERLSKLEKESRELQQKLQTDPKDLPADARTRLSSVDSELQSIRADLSKAGTGSPEANQSWQANIEKRLDAAEKTLDNIDD